MPRLLDNPPLTAIRNVIAASTHAGPLEVHLSLYSLKRDQEWKANLARLRASTSEGNRLRSHSMTSLPDPLPCESPPRDFGDVPTPTAVSAVAAAAAAAAAAGPELDLKTLDYLLCVISAEFRGYDFRCGRLARASVPPPPPFFFTLPPRCAAPRAPFPVCPAVCPPLRGR